MVIPFASSSDPPDVTRRHDGVETLHYVAPPYVHETRNEKVRRTVMRKAYRHETAGSDHLALAATLLGIRVCEVARAGRGEFTYCDVDETGSPAAGSNHAPATISSVVASKIKRAAYGHHVSRALTGREGLS